MRIEGISLEEFQEASEKDEIYIMAGENQYELGFSTSAKKAQFKEKVISPWIVLTFSVPKKLLKMKLVVSDYPPALFEAEKEIAERLNDWDI